MLEVAAACLVVTALLAYLNRRFIGLPITMGAMAPALPSLLLVGLDTGPAAACCSAWRSATSRSDY